MGRFDLIEVTTWAGLTVIMIQNGQNFNKSMYIR
jgi:hypothetical protein